MADAFLVAFRLPNHFRAIFAEGAFAAAFVPAYARIREQGGPDAAKLFGDRIFTLLLASQIVLVGLALVFTPLVIRLLAPDTYRSLSQLMYSRAADIADAARRGGTEHPTLVMVTFLGVVPQARFNPDELNITSRGRLFRPIGIVPLSPTWSSFQLDARQQAAAIYLFEPGISVREQLTVTYDGLSSDAWSRSLRLLDQERARVRARAPPEVKHDSGVP